MPAPLIAVVDDESIFVEMVSEVLGDEGYRITTCLAAHGGLAVIQYHHPDLILLDIRMEHREAGWDLLQDVRNDPTTAHIPIIVCSADVAFLSSKAEELVGQRVETLAKPFDIEVLVEKVARLVDRAGK